MGEQFICLICNRINNSFMIEMIYVGAIFCAMITAYLLITTKTPYQSVSDYTLALFLFSCSYCILAYLLLTYGWMRNVAFLYKTAAPINFLIPPLAYLYVESVLNNRTCYKQKDLWHFIPFIFFLINYIPFYLVPYSQKVALVNAVIKNTKNVYHAHDGMVSETFQLVARELQVLIYLLFQWKLLLEFNKKEILDKLRSHTIDVLRWLKIFTWTCTINFISFILFILLVNLNYNNSLSNLFLKLSEVSFAISFFIFTSYLLYNPNVLYGLPFIKQKMALPVLDKSLPEELMMKEYEQDIDCILQYFVEQRPYLTSGININHVSVALGLPARDISFIINTHFKQRFTDFVNGYRVQFAMKNLEEGYLNQYTLESLAANAGFSSVRTFNRAFQKVNQMSPSAYSATMNNA